jgi:hypothetical protein
VTADPSRLDRRLHPYKADIAARYLEGQVKAERFVEGVLHRVVEPVSDMLDTPDANARSTQALYGEAFVVYQTQGCWAWGQLLTDNYVGWIHAHALVAHDERSVPTHLVRTPLTRACDNTIKVLGTDGLSMGAQLRVTDAAIKVGGSSAQFAQCDAGTIPSAHLQPIDTPVEDWVSMAQLFAHTPYSWGGRSGVGIDCSALVQIGLQQAGVACPRDSDMQESTLGITIDREEGLRRGDLVFWPGHVGIMQDEATLFHANAFAMSTVPEALKVVEMRAGAARTVKRL